MPIYEYVCESCGRVTEALQRIDEPPLKECGHCGGELRKLVSAPAFQFKGSGWYVTDYARASGGGSGRKPESGRADEAPTSGATGAETQSAGETPKAPPAADKSSAKE